MNLPLGSQLPERLPPVHKAQSLIHSPEEGGNGQGHSSVCLSFQFLGQDEIKGDPVSINKNIEVSQTHCNHVCTVFRKAALPEWEQEELMMSLGCPHGDLVSVCWYRCGGHVGAGSFLPPCD